MGVLSQFCMQKTARYLLFADFAPECKKFLLRVAPTDRAITMHSVNFIAIPVCVTLSRRYHKAHQYKAVTSIAKKVYFTFAIH